MAKKESNISVNESTGAIIGDNNKQTVNKTDFKKCPDDKKSGGYPRSMLLIALLTLIVGIIGVILRT